MKTFASRDALHKHLLRGEHFLKEFIVSSFDRVTLISTLNLGRHSALPT